MTTKAYHLIDGEGEFFIRGTTDLDEVKRLLEEHEEIRDNAPEDEDWEVHLNVIRIGLFRFNPCHESMCGEGHGWHLGYANKRGRGVFEGVYCNAHPEAIEFECDDPLTALGLVGETS